MNNYCYQRQINNSFEIVERELRESLKKQGFGIITEIDVQKTVKEKLGIDQEPYKILGACNPKYAHQAILAESNIGVLLPCNVVIYKQKDVVVVSMILPTVQLGKIENPLLKQVAHDVEKKLKTAVDEV